MKVSLLAEDGISKLLEAEMGEEAAKELVDTVLIWNNRYFTYHDLVNIDGVDSLVFLQRAAFLIPSNSPRG